MPNNPLSLSLFFLLLCTLSATTGAADTDHKLITAIQSRLEILGYDPGPPDGQLNQRTRQAIGWFEREAGLPVTGQASPELAKLLYAMVNGETAPEPAPDGPMPALLPDPEPGDDEPDESDTTVVTVYAEPDAGPYSVQTEQIQAYLKTLGFDPGRSHGRLDARTRGTIRAFQARMGLPVTGDGNPDVMDLLGRLIRQPDKGLLAPPQHRHEIDGALRLQRDDGGQITRCQIGDTELDQEWCATFAERKNTDHCKAVLRADASVLLVRCG